MILSEGRKEDVYNKFKGKIDSERKLNSLIEPKSFYDIVLEEPFMEQTNYKYLEPLLTQHFLWNDVYPRQGKELEELEPNMVSTARDYFINIRRTIANIIPKLEFFDRNKDKYPKKDFKQYIGWDFDREFLDLTDGLMRAQNEKKEKEKERKEIVKIYEDNRVLIVKPLSHVASCYYGAGTRWCTTMKGQPERFKQYTRDANLYYIIVKGVPSDNKFYKIAINPKKGQMLRNSTFYDASDNTMSASEKELFFSLIPQEASAKLQEDINESFKSQWKRDMIDQIEDLTTIQQRTVIKLSKTKELTLILRFDDCQPVDFEDETNDDDYIRFTCRYRLSPYPYEVIGATSVFDDDGYILGIVENKRTHIQYNLVFESDPRFEINPEDKGDTHLNDDFEINFSSSVEKDKFDSTMDFLLERTMQKLKYKVQNSENLKVYMQKLGLKVPAQQYGRGFSFSKPTENIIKFYEVMDSIPEGEPIKRVDFMEKAGMVKKKPDGTYVNRGGGNITIKGYFSSWFSALNAAKIIEYVGKKGFKKGPRYEEFREKIFSK
jgi:hypothetical protein